MIKSDSKNIAGTTAVKGFESILYNLFFSNGIYLAIEEDERHFWKGIIECFKRFIELFIIILPLNFTRFFDSCCNEISLNSPFLQIFFNYPKDNFTFFPLCYSLQDIWVG